MKSGVEGSSQVSWSCPGVLRAVLAASTLIYGCEESLSKANSEASVGTAADAGQLDAGPSCADLEEGEACGSDLYCVGARCQAAICGDGVRTASEACDDGNEHLGDGCDPACHVERSGCGNGALDPGEECDDGNWLDQDTCSNRCTLRECGNGRVDFGEECDDENRIDADGCSNTCLVVACRNGRLDPGEECDDGNTVDLADGCTNDCKAAICGNGKIEEYESCDDGNQRDGDACPSNCIGATCGNGEVERGEVCDGQGLEIVKKSDGSSTARYRGCSADCKSFRDDAEDPCSSCQATACRAADDMNILDGCFAAPNGEFGADITDRYFVEHCANVVECALRNECWFDEVKGGSGCYCGSASADDCNQTGPADDAPCVDEWLVAAGTDVNGDVQARFADFTFPSGWAFFLLDCYRKSCGDVCIPPKGPSSE